MALHGGREGGHIRNRRRRSRSISALFGGAHSTDASGIARFGLQLGLQLQEIPFGQLAIRPFGDLAEDPVDLRFELPSEVLLLLDLPLHRFRDHRPQHSDQVVLGKTSAVLVLGRPLFQMGFELIDVRAIGECDEVAAFQVGELGRATNILGKEGSPILEAIEFLSADERGPPHKLGIGKKIPGERPQVCGDPLPVDVRELGDLRLIQIRPFDRHLVALNQLENSRVVAIGAHEMVPHAHAPSVEGGQIAIVSL